MIKNILITGSQGFIGKNLNLGIKKSFPHINILFYTNSSSKKDLENFTLKADLIFHLAGVNRSKDLNDFYEVNRGLTEDICEILINAKK